MKLAINGASKRFGATQALAPVSLDVAGRRVRRHRRPLRLRQIHADAPGRRPYARH